jgi:hypothetical protein
MDVLILYCIFLSGSRSGPDPRSFGAAPGLGLKPPSAPGSPLRPAPLAGASGPAGGAWGASPPVLRPGAGSGGALPLSRQEIAFALTCRLICERRQCIYHAYAKFFVCMHLQCQRQQGLSSPAFLAGDFKTRHGACGGRRGPKCRFLLNLGKIRAKFSLFVLEALMHWGLAALTCIFLIRGGPGPPPGP